MTFAIDLKMARGGWGSRTVVFPYRRAHLLLHPSQSSISSERTVLSERP